MYIAVVEVFIFFKLLLVAFQIAPTVGNWEESAKGDEFLVSNYSLVRLRPLNRWDDSSAVIIMESLYPIQVIHRQAERIRNTSHMQAARPRIVGRPVNRMHLHKKGRRLLYPQMGLPLRGVGPSVVGGGSFGGVGGGTQMDHLLFCVNKCHARLLCVAVSYSRQRQLCHLHPVNPGHKTYTLEVVDGDYEIWAFKQEDSMLQYE